MTHATVTVQPPRDVSADIGETHILMAQALARTPLAPLLDGGRDLFNGKMLRARIAFRLADIDGLPRARVIAHAAVVELVHAASLLHDDVIDNGLLRRSAPAFWVERGAQGAILLGDLLLTQALQLLGERSEASVLAELIRLTGEVCAAEAEQELILRGQPSDFAKCEDIARRKTGALFAFIAFAAARAPDLRAALEEAGYLAGTAYQLADDLLDARGREAEAGKTLGRDRERAKTTAAQWTRTAEERIAELCAQSISTLDPWPEAQSAWCDYLEQDFSPALKKLMG